MWKTLIDLHQKINDQRKLALKDKIIKMKMEKGETIPKYFTNFTQCHDELGSVGTMIPEDYMVSLAILRLSKSWHSYHDSVNGEEKLPDWQRLWLDLMQEDIRMNTRDVSSSKIYYEENYALAIKAKKGKGKSSHSKLDSYHGGKKKYMMKVKRFHCHELGHFSTNCSPKKSKKKSLGAASEALASQFKLEFSLIACIVSSIWEMYGS